jgi:UrcA family protein
MSRLNISVIAAALALTALACPAATAHAQVQAGSLRVSYDDLNLSSPKGAETLMRRLNAAADKVCGWRPSPRQLRAVIRFKACMNDSVSRAVAEVNSPQLTALHTGRTGMVAAAR